MPRHGRVLGTSGCKPSPRRYGGGPQFQTAVDGLVDRLRQHDVGENAPKPGEQMPNFVLPDETGQPSVSTKLLEKGPVAVTFHRGHWCPYCRINTRALAERAGSDRG